MKFKILFAIGFLSIIFSGCEDILDKPPLDQMTQGTYFTNEENMRTFSYGFYSRHFVGYGVGYSYGSYFSFQSLNDDFAPTTPTAFLKNVPTTPSGTNWNFTYVRRANLFIENIKSAPIPAEAKSHWTGVARFFRALEYARLVNTYGDVPWINKVPLETENETLYRPRDPRALVVDSILADFDYAAANVRAVDGTKGLSVNKYVVLAFMSRIMLFEGTWFKYHLGDATKSAAYLAKSKWAANEVITKGGYTLHSDYRACFNSNDLATNKEMILYRKYETALLTHSLNSYNNKEAQSGMSKNLVDSYLCDDGLPILVSPKYLGDKAVNNTMTNRDPRMTLTMAKELRLYGVVSIYSTSGYASIKFLNDATKELPEGSGSLNITDAPVIRYGEVLMNYAEACAELGNITQSDLDLSINVLRNRTGVKVPALQVVGGQPAINGVVYTDTNRDVTVSPIIWEIRRERRIELAMEGFRLDDLRRWKKLEYANTNGTDINRGAWIVKSQWPATLKAVIENNAAEGYITPCVTAASHRTFVDPKVYLDPIPLDQIKLYADQGVELKQNAGWQ